MRQTLKKIVLKLIPLPVKRLIVNEVLQNKNISLDNVYFSQEGEDIILDKVFFDKKNGFYVDIGAHHPVNFSNTYKYYLRGWSGINVDAMPGSMQPFKINRPRDINLEMGVSDNGGVLTFNVFDKPGLNTFDKEIAEKHALELNAKLRQKIDVHTAPLAEILDMHIPEGREIDFMSIDVEGFDLKVLKSNNWDKYKPMVILVESIDASIDSILQSDIYQFLKARGYDLISKTFHTIIFKRQ
jgi:FkbM family methyltransferase